MPSEAVKGHGYAWELELAFPRFHCPPYTSPSYFFHRSPQAWPQYSAHLVHVLLKVPP